MYYFANERKNKKQNFIKIGGVVNFSQILQMDNKIADAHVK